MRDVWLPRQRRRAGADHSRGMRAVSLRVNDVVGVAGFVLPGMRVDMLVTGRPPTADQTMTKTVLQNILVLSAGQTMEPDTQGRAINAPTVTLLVTPVQAELLTLAANEGQCPTGAPQWQRPGHGLHRGPARSRALREEEGSAPGAPSGPARAAGSRTRAREDAPAGAAPAGRDRRDPRDGEDRPGCQCQGWR